MARSASNTVGSGHLTFNVNYALRVVAYRGGRLKVMQREVGKQFTPTCNCHNWPIFSERTQAEQEIERLIQSEAVSDAWCLRLKKCPECLFWHIVNPRNSMTSECVVTGMTRFRHVAAARTYITGVCLVDPDNYAIKACDACFGFHCYPLPYTSKIGEPDMACYRKRRYCTEEDARGVIACVLHKRGTKLRFYPCYECGGFHVTKRRNELLR